MFAKQLGIKTLSPRLIVLLLIASLASSAYGQQPARKGWWKFDDPTNLTAAVPGFGQDLQLVGAHQAIAGPATGNGAVRIGVGSYYKMTHGIGPNGGGQKVNQYSLQFDFRVANVNIWHCFFQTNPSNADDGDCFIDRTGHIGVGATGYSTYAVAPNEWYRLVISVSLGSHYRYYLDGQLLHEGNVQSIDGRFALSPLLLLFADEDGEDGEIDIAEVAIWDRPLTAEEASQLGGFGHGLLDRSLTQVVPYLQSPTPSSIYISWHDTSAAVTKVEYGTSPALGQTATGTSEVISGLFRWHTVKLMGLQPNTEYFYRCVSGSDTSEVAAFRTAPDSTYKGHLRFVIIGDTRSDSAKFGYIVRQAKQKLQQLYGNDIHNHINLVFHVGDIVGYGGTIAQYNNEYFLPLAPLSKSIPTMVSIGNHEAEHEFYYKYMKYEDFSPFAPPNQLAERFYSFSLANTLFLGLNSNSGTGVPPHMQAVQKLWLDSQLAAAENRSSLDFVFTFCHHPGHSEVWPDGNTPYVQNDLLGVMKKYSKVEQLAYGHTHAYERGAMLSAAPNSKGDFHLLLSGGGGAELDRWGMYSNQTDYPEIHVSLDHYHWVLIDIDVENKSYEASMFSYGNPERPLQGELLDRWHRRLNQPAPDKPAANAPIESGANVIFPSSAFAGVDSIMSARVQITATPGQYTSPLLDTTRDWQNIYNVDAQYIPIDRNVGIDLTHLEVPLTRFQPGKTYAWRVRYRDQNLKWSDWSDERQFEIVTAVEEVKASEIPDHFALGQNYPNPFNLSTIITYQMPRRGHVSIKVYNVLGQEVATLVDEEKPAGSYQVEFNTVSLSSGIYFYKMRSGEFTAVRKLNLTR